MNVLRLVVVHSMVRQHLSINKSMRGTKTRKVYVLMEQIITCFVIAFLFTCNAFERTRAIEKSYSYSSGRTMERSFDRKTCIRNFLELNCCATVAGLLHKPQRNRFKWNELMVTVNRRWSRSSRRYVELVSLRLYSMNSPNGCSTRTRNEWMTRRDRLQPMDSFIIIYGGFGK